MTPNEKALIEGLFQRIRATEIATRDADADRLIQAEMSRSPGAAYALAQTVLVQDQALREAHERLQRLEAEQQAFADQREDGAGQGWVGASQRWGGAGQSPGMRAEAQGYRLASSTVSASRAGAAATGEMPRAPGEPEPARQAAAASSRAPSRLRPASPAVRCCSRGSGRCSEEARGRQGGWAGQPALFGAGPWGDAKQGLSDDQLTSSGLAPGDRAASDDFDPDGDGPDTTTTGWTTGSI